MRIPLPVEPAPPTSEEPPRTGAGRITLGDDYRAFIVVPRSYDPARAYPLVTVLHGAGRQDEMLFKGLRDEADRRDAFFLIPRSYQFTWDLIAGGQAEDLRFLTYCLRWLYARYRIDPARQALLGYSDGASYALTLGLSNPTLFPAVMAWAAGFCLVGPEDLGPGEPRPRLFVEYGTNDQIFPYTRVALPMKAALEALGAPLVFRTDEGGIHWPSPAFQPAALDWFFAG